MPKIDRLLLGEIYVRLICSPMTSKESPVVIGTSSPHKMLLNSYNADVIWSSLFEEHHPINGLQSNRELVLFLVKRILLYYLNIFTLYKLTPSFFKIKAYLKVASSKMK